MLWLFSAFHEVDTFTNVYFSEPMHSKVMLNFTDTKKTWLHWLRSACTPESGTKWESSFCPETMEVDDGFVRKPIHSHTHTGDFQAQGSSCCLTSSLNRILI